ncbi:RNA-binding protein [Rhodopirellula sallentina]|uniref:Signal peptide protein n=1 Tax=Rhodopirellula sallentina SM41 TaxID=1263870 RepID=M5U765_9BACT|nr:hypothetical protein [Rhodopirellula sallentina]EMI57327.1 signal peptide protein [Rhodopirellula sallentina SM41]
MSNRIFLSASFAALVCVAGISATAPLNAQEVVKAEPIKAEPTEAKPISPAKASPTVRPLSVTVGLITKNTIEGTLTDTTQLQMQTSFGTASIPLSEVAGVRFASADDATTTVVMLNGDSITGATDVKMITVETEWGTASINGPSIASIMFVPGLTWNSQSGLNGKRWTLSDDKPAQLPTDSQSTGSRPSTSPQPSRNTTRGNTLPPPSRSFQNSSQPFYPSR